MRSSSRWMKLISYSFFDLQLWPFTFGFSLWAPRRFQCATQRSFETLLGVFLVEFVVSCVSLPWSPSLNGTSTKTPSGPCFRVPYFDSTPAALDLLQSRGILVFGDDLWAADWENMTPEQELKKVIEQLEITQKGIILLHDPRARRTAAMMPTSCATCTIRAIGSYTWYRLLPPSRSTPTELLIEGTRLDLSSASGPRIHLSAACVRMQKRRSLASGAIEIAVAPRSSPVVQARRRPQ